MNYTVMKTSYVHQGLLNDLSMDQSELGNSAHSVSQLGLDGCRLDNNRIIKSNYLHQLPTLSLNVFY